ncbi:sulfate adenylyltransferase subunit 1 [Cnuella takakiae]|uniref:sulfate adenylyltransferase n=1 Tax=Cnuella takakiae TaxID=1302690 RepID=A0A1M4X5X4_9BACT|nr:GTP-binding protein [Cnuella takakiae]OLY91524.1 sulfate adenylyltransferase [Cnuella takakiae]SHE88783.1 sulfate adenylyltransferase subunit 1 [Cnuella takakiae]
MDVLRLATAGSVDDGKSTLIGRLLYDTKSITKDKLEAVEASSQRKGLDFVDLSLLTDGLIAEREQGITIDVAHIYFSTDKRKYIIADTPGHVEYTRNMITGASHAEASIVLVDARNGVSEQTRRHLFISSLLEIDTVIVAVNKMDLANYEQATFEGIKANVAGLAQKIGFKGSLTFIPLAAKYGDNVVTLSDKMPWYTGQPLLQYLETMPVHQRDESLPARFHVQFVIRPHSDEHHDFRGYAGKLVSGSLKVGQRVAVLPSLKESTIKAIYSGLNKVEQGHAGDSLNIELEDDVDISRGNTLVPVDAPYQQLQQFAAKLTWMDEQPLTAGKTFLLQHGVNRIKAKINSVAHVIDMSTIEEKADAQAFRLNDIGEVSIKTAKPIFADRYADNPKNGAFILIDEFSNTTVAVGFIL